LREASFLFELFGEDYRGDLEDAEIGEDDKRGCQTHEENPVGFQNPVCSRRKDLREDEKQAKCDANRLERRQKQAVAERPDFDKQNGLKTQRVDNHHTGEEEYDEEKPVPGLPGEFIGN
jgi:hypothetical protein